MHAVKSSVARRFIPPELKLVEAFGYTLGGLFLAHYDGSPVGEFEDAVVIADIVWNVSSEEARIHGRKEVGLPAHFATFSDKASTLPTAARRRAWWDARGWFGGNDQTRSQSPVRQTHSVKVVQRDGNSIVPSFEIAGIPRLFLSDDEDQPWKGPAVQLHLPNFSGKTKEQPSLLKYSCAMNCRVSVVSPARGTDIGGGSDSSESNVKTRDVLFIFKGKPLASISFDDMMMSAGAPSVLHLKDGERKKKKANPGDVGPVVPAASSAISGLVAFPQLLFSSFEKIVLKRDALCAGHFEQSVLSNSPRTYESTECSHVVFGNSSNTGSSQQESSSQVLLATSNAAFPSQAVSSATLPLLNRQAEGESFECCLSIMSNIFEPAL